MSFEFKRADPRAIRDEVVDFFWSHHRWPGDTREDYLRIWDWRYSALSEGPSLSYLARLKETGEVVGHIGVYRRNFRIGSTDISVCVPGNLFVHPDWQQNIVGVRLLMFLRSLIQGREFDLVLGFGNQVANAMLLRLGFRELGAMHSYVDVRDAGSVLRRRKPALAVIAPLVNVGFAARRLLARRRARPDAVLRVRKLAAEHFVSLDRSHWAPPARLVACESNRFVIDRYLNEPQAERHLYGLFDPRTDSLEAFIVTEPAPRIKIWDCQSNPATIDSVSAIEALASALDRVETVLVPTQPESRLASDLVGAGFLDREATDPTEAGTYLSVYSLPDNPCSAVLSDPANWDIWLGSRHY
ncbi:MAG TPA: GNAT family N-acetyltransferase [Gemmatimonadaceae bacterium]